MDIGFQEKKTMEQQEVEKSHAAAQPDRMRSILQKYLVNKQEEVRATVQALEACKKELGVRTILGVSNISFGLPCRPYLNTTFLTMAMYAGLDLAIMNPSSEEMMAAVYAYNVLTNRDEQSTKYIERYASRVPASVALKQAAQAAPAASAAASGESAELTGPYAPLMKAVEKGLKGDAAAQTRALLETKQPLDVVDEALIPALDIVGAKYEKGTLFLPQLLQAASAAQTRKFFVTNVASRNDIPAIIHRPAKGINAIQIAAMMTRP